MHKRRAVIVSFDTIEDVAKRLGAISPRGALVQKHHKVLKKNRAYRSIRAHALNQLRQLAEIKAMHHMAPWDDMDDEMTDAELRKSETPTTFTMAHVPTLRSTL